MSHWSEMNRRSQGTVQRQEDIDHRLIELKKNVMQREQEFENLRIAVNDLGKQVNDFHHNTLSPSLRWPMSYEIMSYERPLNLTVVVDSNDADQLENLLANLNKEIIYLEDRKQRLEREKERCSKLIGIDVQKRMEKNEKQMEKDKEMKRKERKDKVKKFFSSLHQDLIFMGVFGLILLVLAVAIVTILYNKYDVCAAIMNRLLVGLLIDTCILFLLGLTYDIFSEN